MSNIRNRVRKLEETFGRDNSLTFRNYLGEFLKLISGRSRGLPSQDKDDDPEVEMAIAHLLAKYLSQREPGLTKFTEEYGKSSEKLGLAPLWAMQEFIKHISR